VWHGGIGVGDSDFGIGGNGAGSVDGMDQSCRRDTVLGTKLLAMILRRKDG